MRLYTLNDDFQRVDVVDDFISLIWTERYTAAGDVALVTNPSAKMMAMIPEGTFLQIDDSDEIMLVETVLNEENQLKISGNTLDFFLNQRVLRSTPNHEDRYWNATAPPGIIMAEAVRRMCIAGGDYTGPGFALNDADQVIPGLDLGDVDGTGGDVTIAVPFGPIYEAIQQIASTYSIGFAVYLVFVDDYAYQLRFTAYRGLNRTSEQTVNELVRFSPSTDTLTNVKELRSIANYKTVAYAFAPSNPGGLSGVAGSAVAPGGENRGFKRRVLMIFADDISTDQFTSDDELLKALNQRAADGLANNNYTKVIDGEVVPQSQYQYGVHYKLGDIVELQAPSKLTQKARITEYIRSHDQTGERAYPTVSVID